MNSVRLSRIFFRLFPAFCLGFAILLTAPACSKKSGCPAETASVKTGKNGELPAKRGKSNLFPKDMRKRMGS